MSTSAPTAESTLDRHDANSDVVVFPLERPLIRSRRRFANSAPALLLPCFVAGPENRLAAFVARQPDSIFLMGNPVLLVGPSGSGKTSLALHLAVRCANQLGCTEASDVLHLPAIDFARRFSEAVAADDLPPLQQQINDARVLIIDDLHLMTSKTAAQEELANRIEYRCEQGLPSVLTCRRLPSEVRGIRPSLASRTLPGLTIPLRCPSGASRLLALGELSMQAGLAFDASMLAMLDEGLDDSLPIRSLSAAVKQIDLWCRMNQQPPCYEAIAKALDSISPIEEVSLPKISSNVARFFRLKSSDLRSGSRKQHIVRARSLAMFLARRITSLSMNDIGGYFGGRDHSTVLHAIRKTDELLDSDSDLRLALDELTERLNYRS